MANAPNNLPNFSAEIALPEHATLMRRTYVSCQNYAQQQKTFKARAITILFLLAVPFTAAKYIVQAPLCTLYDFIRLRNGFNSLGTKLTEATNCVVFGLLQTSYLWCNAYSHVESIRNRQQQINQLEDAVARGNGVLFQRNGQIAQLNQQVATLQVEKDEIHAIICEMDRNITSQDAHIERLEGQLAAQRDNADISANRDLTSPEGKIERLKAELDRTKEDLRFKKEELTRKKDELARRELEISDHTAEINGMLSQWNDREIECLELKGKLALSVQKMEDIIAFMAVRWAKEKNKWEEEKKRLQEAMPVEKNPSVLPVCTAPSEQLAVEPIENQAIADRLMSQFYEMDVDDELFSDEELKLYDKYEKEVRTAWSKIKEYLSAFFTTASAAYDKVIEEVFNLVFDGKAQWKIHRYSLFSPHHRNFFKFYENLQSRYLNSVNAEKEIVDLFGKAFNELVKLKKENARVYHKNYVRILRAPLERLFQKQSELNPEFFNFVVSNVDKRFSETKINTFYEKLVFWMAGEGNKNLADELQPASLSQKLDLVHKGIYNAPGQFKSPKHHLAWKKMDGIKATFDPLGDTNHPSIMGTASYKNAQGVVKDVKIMRTGVPVCGRTTPYGKKEHYWEYEDVALAPEYLSHCQNILNQNQNMLVILHLDPAQLIELGEYRSPRSVFEYARQLDLALKIREATWINLFRKLGRKFVGRINVCVFPLDGEWIHNMSRGEAQPKKAYIDSLKAFLTENGSPFKLPSFVFALDDAKNGKKDIRQEHELINKVVDEVAATYFVDSVTVDARDRKAFLMLFYSRMAEHLRINHNISFEQRNCKDAVDRTEAVAGVHLADLVNRLGLINDDETQRKVIAETEAPALSYVKREMLQSRQNFALAGMRHLEQMPGKTPPAINGFSLTSFDFHEDPTQKLTSNDSPPGSCERPSSPISPTPPLSSASQDDL